MRPKIRTRSCTDSHAVKTLVGFRVPVDWQFVGTKQAYLAALRGCQISSEILPSVSFETPPSRYSDVLGEREGATPLRCSA